MGVSWVLGTQRSKPGLLLHPPGSACQHAPAPLAANSPSATLWDPSQALSDTARGPHDPGWHGHALWGGSAKVAAPSPCTWLPVSCPSTCPRVTFFSAGSQEGDRPGANFRVKEPGPAFLRQVPPFSLGFRAPAGLGHGGASQEGRC